MFLSRYMYNTLCFFFMGDVKSERVKEFNLHKIYSLNLFGFILVHASFHN